MKISPETLKDKIKWWLVPSFPRKILTIYDKNGEVYECMEDEIEYTIRTEHITIIKCKYEEAGGEVRYKHAAVMGQDPFIYAELFRPSELFGRETLKWTMYWAFLLYSVFVFLMMFNIVNEYIFFMMLTLGVYIMSVNRFRFNSPSIRSISLHEFGSIEGYQLYVPGPQPQSSLTFSQVMRFVGRLYDPKVKDKAMEELMKEVDTLREVVKRLYGVIIRIERQSDRIYDASYRLARLMAHDVLQEIEERAEKEISRAKKFYIILAGVGALVGFFIGYIIGQNVTISITPPQTTTTFITTLPPPP